MSVLEKEIEKNYKMGLKKVKITNDELINRFFPAFQSLSELPSNANSGKLKYAIKRTLPSLQQAAKKYNDKRKDIFEERAKLDENGNPLFDKENNYLFESKELRKEAFKELEKLGDETVEIEIYPIKKEDIEKCTTLSIGAELNLGDFIILDEENN